MKKFLFSLTLSFCVQINAQSLKDAHRYVKMPEGSAHTAMGGLLEQLGDFLPSISTLQALFFCF